MEEKLKKPEWAPDFGEARFVPSWGASVTGVRKFLIAYNVNMVCTKEQAHRFKLIIKLLLYFKFDHIVCDLFKNILTRWVVYC
jgi:glutamate formiminotransferase